MTAPGEVTRLLAALNDGDPEARDALAPLVYQELRRLAESYMRRERAEHTLQPTALVHEAWLRLADQTRVEWRGRAHFFGIAAQAMRRILVDHHRRSTAERRDRDRVVTLVDDVAGPGSDPLDLLALDQALDALGARDPRAARIVELRFFAGLDVEAAAEVMGISAPTVKRDWRMAKAWLYRRLESEPSPDGGEAGTP